MSPRRHPLILFGCETPGLAVAENLRGQGIEFLLAGSTPESVAAARAKGLDAVAVDFADDDALRGVGIGDWARTIFCLYREPASNLFLTLSARALAPELEIIAICESPESRSKLLAAGADKTIDPYVITGQTIHEIIRRPLILDTMERTLFGSADLELAEIAVGAASPHAGQPLSAVDLTGFDLVLLGMVDPALGPDLMFRTSVADHRLKEGNLLVVIGPVGEIQRFRAKFQP
jgi:voltage-gated potassium channel